MAMSPWWAVNPIGAVAYGIDYMGRKSDEEAQAAQKMAQAQMEEQQKTRQKALQYAAPSNQELQMMEQELESIKRTNSLQMQALGRAEQTINAIDPNIMEASRQVYAAMKGQQTQWMAPVQRERERAKQSLQTQLADRLGPNYMNTTAGRQAMSEFDRQTSEMLTQAQLGGMGQLTDIAGKFSQMRPDEFGMATKMGAYTGEALGQVMNQQQNIRSRQTNAVLGTPTAQYAGAPFLGDYLSAQASQKRAASIFDIGGKLGGAAIGAAAGGPAGASAGSQLGGLGASAATGGQTWDIQNTRANAWMKEPGPTPGSY